MLLPTSRRKLPLSALERVSYADGNYTVVLTEGGAETAFVIVDGEGTATEQFVGSPAAGSLIVRSAPSIDCATYSVPASQTERLLEAIQAWIKTRVMQ